MGRFPPDNSSFPDAPVPTTQFAIQQLADVLVGDTRFMAEGYRLLSGAITKVRSLRWPDQPKGVHIFVPRLSLNTSATHLAQYTRQVPDLLSMPREEKDGCWLWLDNAYGARPTTDGLPLGRCYQPDIGPVELDSYVRFLRLYRQIVDARASAVTKVVAVHALAQKEQFIDYCDRHCQLDPMFPLSRFQLTINLLPGVGIKTRDQLLACGLKSIPAVATADEAHLGQALEKRPLDAARLKSAAEDLLDRALEPVSGEKLGPSLSGR